MLDHKTDSTAVTAPVIEDPNSGLHYARRGSIANDEAADGQIEGYDAERMRARTLLTAEEEKKLLRKIDWHLMTLCSIMFLLKNIDADNVSNARIMNKGTKSNIMTQLGMTANEYNLVTTIYYVSDFSPRNRSSSQLIALRFLTLLPKHHQICSSNVCCHHDGNLGSWSPGV